MIGYKLKLRRLALFVGLIFFPLVILANGLLHLEKEGLSSASLADLYESARLGSSVRIRMLSTSNSQAGEVSRKLIVANPDVQTNVVMTFMDSTAEVKVTDFLLAELRNSGLGDSENYDCFVAEVDLNGSLSLVKASSVRANLGVKLPSFRYGRRGDLRMASPTERKLKSVSLEVPTPIFVDGVSDAERERVTAEFRNTAAERGVYRYESLSSHVCVIVRRNSPFELRFSAFPQVI